jgi:hypothetical protein
MQFQTIKPLETLRDVLGGFEEEKKNIYYSLTNL